MKKLFTILLIFYSLIVSATNYHVDNTGTGDTLATIAEVNALSLSGDDTVFFKRGCVWRGTLVLPSSGTAGHYIVFAAYGTGAKPKILGSNLAITWTPTGVTNVWQAATSLTNPDPYGGYGSVWVVNTDTIWGAKKTYAANHANMTTLYDWSWNANVVYLYSIADPDTYTAVEASQRFYCVDGNQKDYICFNGIGFFFSQWANLSEHDTETGNRTGFIMRNCFSAYCGQPNGAGYGVAFCYNDMLIENNVFHDCGRRGASINNNGSTSEFGHFDISGIIVQNNTFYNGFHTTGLDLETGASGYSTGDIADVIFRNNLTYDDSTRNVTAGGYNAFFAQGPHGGTGIITGLYVYNNIFKWSPGNSLSLEDVDEAYIYNNVFYEVGVNGAYQFYADDGTANVKVKNNIFFTNSTLNTDIPVVYTGVTDALFDINYNIYYKGGNTTSRIHLMNGSSYYMNTAFPTAKGFETNGIKDNPDFVSLTDYHLQAGSPAIQAGVGVGLSTDKDGNVWGATPSIGAYEYDSDPPTPTDLPVCSFAGEVGWYSNLKSISVTIMGGWTDDGGGTITDAGVVISTSANPTTSDRKISFNDMIATSGYFNEIITGLKGNTTYHIRIFATNESGTAYSADQQLTTSVYNVLMNNGKVVIYNGNVVIIK